MTFPYELSCSPFLWPLLMLCLQSMTDDWSKYVHITQSVFMSAFLFFFFGLLNWVWICQTFSMMVLGGAGYNYYLVGGHISCPRDKVSIKENHPNKRWLSETGAWETVLIIQAMG